jgi:hypothetical protein
MNAKPDIASATVHLDDLNNRTVGVLKLIANIGRRAGVRGSACGDQE